MSLTENLPLKNYRLSVIVFNSIFNRLLFDTVNLSLISRTLLSNFFLSLTSKSMARQLFLQITICNQHIIILNVPSQRISISATCIMFMVLFCHLFTASQIHNYIASIYGKNIIDILYDFGEMIPKYINVYHINQNPTDFNSIVQVIEINYLSCFTVLIFFFFQKTLRAAITEQLFTTIILLKKNYT